MNEELVRMIAIVKRDIEAAAKGDRQFAALLQKYRKPTGNASYSYKEVYKLSEQMGDAISRSLTRQIGPAVYENTILYEQIAAGILQPVLSPYWIETVDFAAVVQDAQYKELGLGLQAVKPPVNTNRIDGLTSILVGADDYSMVTFALGEPIVNFGMSSVDDTIRENAAFQKDVGLEPMITRTVVNGCCEWCQDLAGTYPYEEVSGAGNDIWRRHERCRCTIDVKTLKRRR